MEASASDVGTVADSRDDAEAAVPASVEQDVIGQSEQPTGAKGRNSGDDVHDTPQPMQMADGVASASADSEANPRGTSSGSASSGRLDPSMEECMSLRNRQLAVRLCPEWICKLLQPDELAEFCDLLPHWVQEQLRKSGEEGSSVVVNVFDISCHFFGISSCIDIAKLFAAGEARKCLSQVLVLKACRNDIGEPGAFILADWLRTAEGLQELHLSHNQIREDGAFALMTASIACCSATRAKKKATSKRASTRGLWLRLDHNWIDTGQALRRLEWADDRISIRNVPDYDGYGTYRPSCAIFTTAWNGDNHAEPSEAVFLPHFIEQAVRTPHTRWKEKWMRQNQVYGYPPWQQEMWRPLPTERAPSGKASSNEGNAQASGWEPEEELNAENEVSQKPQPPPQQPQRHVDKEHRQEKEEEQRGERGQEPEQEKCAQEGNARAGHRATPTGQQSTQNASKSGPEKFANPWNQYVWETTTWEKTTWETRAWKTCPWVERSCQKEVWKREAWQPRSPPPAAPPGAWGPSISRPAPDNPAAKPAGSTGARGSKMVAKPRQAKRRASSPQELLDIITGLRVSLAHFWCGEDGEKYALSVDETRERFTLDLEGEETIATTWQCACSRHGVLEWSRVTYNVVDGMLWWEDVYALDPTSLGLMPDKVYWTAVTGNDLGVTKISEVVWHRYHTNIAKKLGKQTRFDPHELGLTMAMKQVQMKNAIATANGNANANPPTRLQEAQSPPEPAEDYVPEVATITLRRLPETEEYDESEDPSLWARRKLIKAGFEDQEILRVLPVGPVDFTVEILVGGPQGLDLSTPVTSSTVATTSNTMSAPAANLVRPGATNGRGSCMDLGSPEWRHALGKKIQEHWMTEEHPDQPRQYGPRRQRRDANRFRSEIYDDSADNPDGKPLGENQDEPVWRWVTRLVAKMLLIAWFTMEGTCMLQMMISIMRRYHGAPVGGVLRNGTTGTDLAMPSVQVDEL